MKNINAKSRILIVISPWKTKEIKRCKLLSKRITKRVRRSQKLLPLRNND